MDDFFPTPDATCAADPDDTPQPAWLSPPVDVIPASVALDVLIGRSDEAAVFLTSWRAYPVGVAMTLCLVSRRAQPFDLAGESGPYAAFDGADPEHRLRWGFLLPDGARVTNVDPQPELNSDDEPTRPVLSEGSGSGWSRSANLEYWLWPLPEAGTMIVVCEWERFGIARTVTEVDASVLVDAAVASRSVWPTH